MRVVLIHGYNANPEMNFHPWLIQQLKDKGIEVIAPKIPLEGEPDVLLCIDALVQAVGRLDEKTIILGHSLGGVLALRYLEAAEAVSTPRAVMLIAAPWQTKSETIKNLFLSEFDYDVVAWKAKEFVIVHDKEDTMVPFDHALKYQKMLNAELIETTGNNHYMDAEYPILFETILRKSEPMPPIEPGLTLDNRYADIP